MKPLKIDAEIIYNRIDAAIYRLKQSTLYNYDIYNEIDKKLTLGSFTDVLDCRDSFKKDINKKRIQD